MRLMRYVYILMALRYVCASLLLLDSSPSRASSVRLNHFMPANVDDCVDNGVDVGVDTVVSVSVSVSVCDSTIDKPDKRAEQVAFLMLGVSSSKYRARLKNTSNAEFVVISVPS